jgi:chromosome segregation ATPase
MANTYRTEIDRLGHYLSTLQEEYDSLDQTMFDIEQALQMFYKRLTELNTERLHIEHSYSTLSTTLMDYRPDIYTGIIAEEEAIRGYITNYTRMLEVLQSKCDHNAKRSQTYVRQQTRMVRSLHRKIVPLR